VAIAGAGPAGASLAIALARAGARVTLFEKDAEPRLKACGEGILPHGVRALAEVVGGLPDGARVRGLRFVAGGMSVVADFPEGFGLVVRRDRLHAWLRERAAATPGVDLRLATRYAPCGESFTVGADGSARSSIAGCPRVRPSSAGSGCRRTSEASRASRTGSKSSFTKRARSTWRRAAVGKRSWLRCFTRTAFTATA